MSAQRGDVQASRGFGEGWRRGPRTQEWNQATRLTGWKSHSPEGEQGPPCAQDPRACWIPLKVVPLCD